ncbi:hypothetical protein BP5796_01267 [Coleophoma crateriformis]|uniref:Zinc transporter n=1 Tax=Coleophoma crateriformis TaxID=565419 RepID=A0A3D8SZX3_9HELO|nr:hypothetical protein BP5796_01267 [Coleophoma crateriformis]
MASSYALPGASMTHSHHGHVHPHSHSHTHSASPHRPASFASNTPRALRTGSTTGSLHAHAHTDSHSTLHPHDQNHNTHSPSSEDSNSSGNGSNEWQGNPDPFAAQRESDAQKHAHSPDEPPASNGTAHDHHHIHNHGDDHKHDHSDHSHGTGAETRSRFTSAILPFVTGYPLLHTILTEKDSRRIFYFMSLNFAFMMVQAFYGFVTDSLGLLSDSIHMLFDCLALAVGLFAAVASKWPPSKRFPYGLGKIESLSGFGNGVFLILISIEIMIEAVERLSEGRETKRLMELFVVSSLGLLVNLVGMACFGHHGHAGHDHGGHSHGHSHSHSHGHSHSHSHEKSHSHSHDHDSGNHEHDHSAATLPLGESKPAAAHSHGGHSHSHDNENMRGIFLHILADTMGSAAVIVSTMLIYFVGWSGWDPLASAIIAILIFLSSIPLVTSSAKKLLLTVPDDTEYTLRETLAAVSGLRGVASYTVPRFWLGDKVGENDSEHVLGVIHICATRGSDLEDVRTRTRTLLLAHGVDAVVQVEAFGESGCWCGSNGNGNGHMRRPSRLSG